MIARIANALSWRAKAALIALLGVVAMIIADLVFPPPLHRAEDLSRMVLDRNGQALHVFSNSENRWRIAARLEEIDPIFLDRLVAVEDRRFWRHPGVDLRAMMRAAKDSLGAGEFVSGASTITMQTARLLEPRPRTIQSKLIEIARAIQIERRLTKSEILALYLTLAPYGGNLEGVEAASRAYFDRSPRRLTDAQQALLIALPQAPEARRPDKRGAMARAARAKILDDLITKELINSSRAHEAAQSSMPSKRHRFPARAYHAARRASKLSDEPTVRTALDGNLQAAAKAIVARHADEAPDGATASLLIVENDTRLVRAYVGSSGRDAPGGWIDLTRAVRSPGSTLKPFIYAMGLDNGLIGPDTVIDDMPRRFGDYAPENFDRRFRGEVRVRDALQHSLNLPAVDILNRLGAARFYGSLSAAGITMRTRRGAEKETGLALALGGAGVTAHEIAALYAGLAEGGAIEPLELLERDGPDASHRLMTKESAQTVSRILAAAPTLPGRMPAALSRSAPEISYKTGTSYGYRDAWAAGHSGAFTVVAWIGRADGAPRPGETGRKAAAPLLFDAFDTIARRNSGALSTTKPAGEATPQSGPLVLSHAVQPGPEIIFPRAGVELFVDPNTERSIALAARGGAGRFRWYVNGDHIEQGNTEGRVHWRPEDEGYHHVTVVDGDGRAASAQVKVRIIQ